MPPTLSSSAAKSMTQEIKTKVAKSALPGRCAYGRPRAKGSSGRSGRWQAEIEAHRLTALQVGPYHSSYSSWGDTPC